MEIISRNQETRRQRDKETNTKHGKKNINIHF